MCGHDRRLSLSAEIRELEELLAATPEESAIERMSLKARLQTVKDLLQDEILDRRKTLFDAFSRQEGPPL